MTGVVPRPDLDVEAVVAPFRGLASGMDLAIDGPSGTLASTSSEPPPPDAFTRPIEAGPLAGGRVRAWGGDGDPAMTTAILAALAAALGGAAAQGLATQAADRTARDRLIEEELAHGRSLQRSFVSLEAPDVPGYEVASHYEAAREVGGDFFELFRLRRRGRPLSVVIADVTGKGIAAALLMAFSRPLLHAAIDQTGGPAAALERINSILVEERRSSLFITALCARLDLGTGTLSVANAGHEPPLLARADGSPIECLLGSGPLIGAFSDLRLPEVSTVIAAGDVALFYTDGITDARSSSGERFEERRLFEAVASARGGTAQDVVDAVSSAVDRFQGAVEPADDITVVAIRRLPDDRLPRKGRTQPAGPSGT